MSYVEIRLRGRIDQDWSEWLHGLEISYTGTKETILSGSLPDQAALYGLLSRLRDLGLTLLSVDCMDREPDG